MRKILNTKLLAQHFEFNPTPHLMLDNAKSIARMYSIMENCISVLSDLRTRKSYIYNGAVANLLGLSADQTEITSIWEDELLNKVHPEDLEVNKIILRSLYPIQEQQMEMRKLK